MNSRNPLSPGGKPAFGTQEFAHHFPDTANRISHVEQSLAELRSDVQRYISLSETMYKRLIEDKDSLTVKISALEGTIRGLEGQINLLSEQQNLQTQKKIAMNAAWISGLLALASAIIGAVVGFILGSR